MKLLAPLVFILLSSTGCELMRTKGYQERDMLADCTDVCDGKIEYFKTESTGGMSCFCQRGRAP